MEGRCVRTSPRDPERETFFLVFHVLETSARPRNRLRLACHAWSRFPASLAGCEGRHFAFRPTSLRGGRDDGRTNGLRCRPGQIGYVEATVPACDPIEMPWNGRPVFSCCQVEGRTSVRVRTYYLIRNASATLNPNPYKPL